MKNLSHISILKGVAILLVVIGHFYPQAFHMSIWDKINKTIYLFHMPLFMVISGYLYANSNRTFDSLNAYATFIRNKSLRLLLPYFFISSIIIFLKLLAQQFFILQYPIDAKTIFFHIFIQPMGGPTTFLWFLYTLWMIFAIYPLLKKIFKFDVIILLFSIILFNIEVTSYFSLDLLIKYLLFFSIGIIFFKIHSLGTNIYFILFIACLLGEAYSDTILLKSLVGITGLWLFSLLIDTYVNSHFIRQFVLLGTYSSAIYLFHTFTMSPIRLLAEKFIGYSATTFYPIAFFVILGGVLIPIYLAKKIEPYKIINLVLLGNKNEQK